MLESIIRTVVPLVVALVLGWAAKVSLNLDGDAVTSIVTAVIGTLYYAIARLVEKAWPALGSVLLSLGLTRKQPVYSKAMGAKRM